MAKGDEAESSQAAINRIHAALAPRIAILSSNEVQDILSPNHFESFSELLQPFQEQIENVTVRTSQLETRQCPTFALAFDDLDVWSPNSTASSSASVFTPADLIQQQQVGGTSPSTSPSTSRKRSNPNVNTRPEVLLDAISARISSKSKSLWETREASKDHHRRQSKRSKK